MAENGVLGVVDGDLPLLKSAAALSLAAALRMHPNEVASEMPTFDGSAEAVLADLERHSNAKDFPIVFGMNGHELASYV
jgi:hypothetical protein